MSMRSIRFASALFGMLSLFGYAAAQEGSEALYIADGKLQSGKWAEARAAYERLEKTPRFRNAAVIGIDRSLRAVGEYDQALAKLAQARKEDDHPDLAAAQADLLFDLGRWKEASESADAALEKDKNHFLARWVKARLLRDGGDLKAADATVRWFVREYTKASNEDKDIKDVDKLLIVAQAASENARWHSLSEQFKFIINQLINDDILKAHPKAWPAELLAGTLLLEKYNRPEAMEAFDKALKVNPHAAEAHVGKGMVSIQMYELKDAEAAADRALKINPKLRSALCLKADVMMMAEDNPAAMAALEKAAEINPRDEEVLARLAAVAFLLNKQPRLNEIIAQVEAFDSKPIAFYTRLAHVLEERKVYKPAVEYYRKAIALGEPFPGPRAGLAMLQLRLGLEEEARPLLNKAFDGDPFNVRVSNMLKVLRHLDKYETMKTRHFDIRFDPKTDKVMADFLADYLEEIHAKLTVEFGYEPKERILVELFNSHEMFSGRTIGLPDLHTIGASTGPVVTIASPHAKGLSRTFNWGRVVRHELVHVFNLTQTDFKVPHWLTEGLATRNEGYPRPHAWSKELKRAYDAKTLLDLESILLGFVRPRSQDEWMLAYCQSWLYVEYLAEKYGPDKIGKMLTAYRDGSDTAVAIRKVCGVTKAEFEAGYKTYLGKIVASIPAAGAAKDAEQTIEELEEARDKAADDLEIAAKLAEQYQKKERPADARRLVETVLKRKPEHPLALLVKSRLLQAAGDTDAAKAILVAAYKDNPKDFGIMQALIRAYREGDDSAKAIALLESGRKLYPLDGNWLDQLIEIYRQREDTDHLADVLKEKSQFDAEDIDSRVQLGQLLIAEKKFAEAEQIGMEAIRIDVLNPAARRIVLTSLREQNKTVELNTLEKRFGSKPDPNDDE